MRNHGNRRDFMKLMTASALAPAFAESVGISKGGSSMAMGFKPRVEKWGIQEISLKSSKSYSNPFADVRLECEFKPAHQGHSVDAAGFYDGDNTWKVRLMPTAEGEWTYRTKSNDSDLNGKTGSFACSPPEPCNHGPVRVQNQDHFGYADGTPLFVLGTTLYNWVHRDEALQRQTLESLKQSPFNKVRFCIFPKWYPYNRVEPPLYPYARKGADKFDYERFNPAYFRHIEERLSDLEALGIQADLIMFHPYDKWGFSKMTPAQDDAYLHYLITRLASFRNVWWTMANEWDFIKPPKNWDHIFQTVQKADPYGHLRGIHNGRLWYDHSKPWVTHCDLQLQGGDTYATALGARLKYGKPVLMDEYGYEGNNMMQWGSLTGRRETSRHWGVTMAGGYASHGETYVHPGDILWWAVGGKLVGESPARLRFLKQLFSNTPYQQLQPLPDSVKGGTALGKKGEVYLFHFSEIGYREELQVRIEGIGAFNVEMIDPWQMKTYSLGRVGPGTHTFALPFIPNLLRATRITASGPGPGQLHSVQELLKGWESLKS
jgi:Domain of unknown function (DUF5060)/Protein of unknown function (DUF4038)